MDIFEFEDYKTFVNTWIQSRPKNGYGQYKKLSDFMKIISVVTSQIFKGDRNLSLEQACEVANFIGLEEKAKNYFLLLVQLSRAASIDLKKTIQNQINESRKKAGTLKSRICHDEISNKEKATFYSHWYYSATRIATDIPWINNDEDISSALNLDRQTTSKVLNFLLENNLVKESNGILEVGPRVTHLGTDSPYINLHRTNWRVKGLQAMQSSDRDDEVFYSGPMALSKEAAQKIRNLVLGLIENSTSVASNSKSETLACLNVDWFLMKD